MIEHSRYRLITRVAADEHSHIYRAEMVGIEGFQKPVFIRVGPPADEAPILMGQTRALARTSHPNVCKVLDVETSGHAFFSVHEWVDGIVLSDFREWIVANQPLPWGQAALLASELAAGLLAVRRTHSRDVSQPAFNNYSVAIGRDGTARYAGFAMSPGDMSSANPSDVARLARLVVELASGRRLETDPILRHSFGQLEAPSRLRGLLQRTMDHSESFALAEFAYELERSVNTMGEQVSSHQMAKLVQAANPCPVAPAPPISLAGETLRMRPPKGRFRKPSEPPAEPRPITESSEYEIEVG